MDVSRTLRAAPPGSGDRAGEPCPRCGESAGGPPPVRAASLGGVDVRRCGRCGTRSTSGPPPRLMFSCEACGLPFLSEDLLPRAEHRCPPCRAGESTPGLPEAIVVRATEREVRAALSGTWGFVSAPPLDAYLDRITGQLAGRVEGARTSSRVVLVDESVHRTLALPSGTLLVSVGLFGFLEDEAELAFVLGHELAHAASGDAAVRLVRLGFDAVSRDEQSPSAAAWTEAAMDLARLGYGRRRERDADARSVEAMLALDYDPESALRFLRRTQAAIERADPAVSEVALSHPPPADRIQRVERILWGRVRGDRVLRVNREVFRRAAGPSALRALARTELVVGAAAEPDPAPAPAGSSRLVALALAGAALAIAALGAWWLLR